MQDTLFCCIYNVVSQLIESIFFCSFFLFLSRLIIWKYACAMIYPTNPAMLGLVFDSNIKKQHLKLDFMTITGFVLKEQSKHPESRGDLTILLNHILLGCKFVCSVVNKVFFSLLYPIINTRLGRENHVNMLCCHVLTFSSQNIFMTTFYSQAGLAKLLCWRDQC